MEGSLAIARWLIHSCAVAAYEISKVVCTNHADRGDSVYLHTRAVALRARQFFFAAFAAVHKPSKAVENCSAAVMNLPTTAAADSRLTLPSGIASNTRLFTVVRARVTRRQFGLKLAAA
jgi:hypothetical protein